MAELSILAQATAVLALALIAARAAYRAPAAVRALLLASTFAVLLVLPVASLTVPKRTIEIPAAYTTESVAFFADDLTNAQPIGAAAATDNRGGDGRPFTMPPLSTILRAVWAVGSLLFAGSLAVALIRLRRLRRRGLPWLDGRALVETIAHQSGVRRPVEVFLHEDLGAPVTCGALRPAVALPFDALQWGDAELRHALIHEVEHVRRCDWAVQLIARSACALYWFHPLAWIAWRQLCVEAERACDDAVLRGAERTAYAEQLVTLARRLKSSPAPLLSMADRSNLATRVEAVLDAAQARGRVGAVAAGLILSTAIGVAAAISPFHVVNASTGHATASPQAGVADGNARRMAFEVASIRVNETADGPRGILPTPGGRFTALGLTLKVLIALAYGSSGALFDDQIVGGPDWLSSVRFDIVATEDPAAASQGDIQTRMYAMLRTLLEDRFKLRLRKETRELPIFDLVMANERRTPGPRLRPTAADCAALSADPMRGCGFRRRAAGLITAEGLEMGSLAEALSRQPGVQRVVRDRTGLQGRFDLELEFIPETLAANAGTEPAATATRASAPTLFTALQEQLGLKLEARRGPLDVLVVEGAERPSPDDAPQAPLPPQASTAEPAGFEVASIKRNRTNDPARARVEPGGRFTAVNTPVIPIVRQAYGLRPFQILNAPDWTASERYDILAKAPEGASFGMEAVAPFLRALLRDRFAFSARIETHDMPVYELVAARPDRKPGPKLESSAVDCTAAMPSRGAGGPADKPPCAQLGQLLGAALNIRRYEMRGYPMSSFAQMLGGALDRAVVDKTGLAGTWNIELDFTQDSAASPAPGDAPAIFTALQEQLGLKLEPARGPVEMLVIVRIERPTED